GFAGAYEFPEAREIRYDRSSTRRHRLSHGHPEGLTLFGKAGIAKHIELPVVLREPGFVVLGSGEQQVFSEGGAQWAPNRLGVVFTCATLGHGRGTDELQSP